MFKKRRGIKIPYNEQGFIYFACMNVKNLSEELQQKIRTLCNEVAGEHSEALYKMLTDDTVNIHAVAMRYYISESQLYLYRKRFYEMWNKNRVSERIG